MISAASLQGSSQTAANLQAHLADMQMALEEAEEMLRRPPSLALFETEAAAAAAALSEKQPGLSHKWTCSVCTVQAACYLSG